jgi:hypothetical protein
MSALAGRSKSIIALLLVFGPALFLIFISTRSCEHKFFELPNYGKLEDISFQVYGKDKTYNLKDFRDEVILITTLQPSCPSDCAISFWHVDQMHFQHIRKNKRKKLKQTRIISFVTDGKGNPASQEEIRTLQQSIADRVEAYDPDLWLLATGDVKKLYNIEQNGQSLLQVGEEYYGGQAFQELMLLVDKSGHLRMVLRGNTEGMVRKMKEHVALLHKQYDKERKKGENR